MCSDDWLQICDCRLYCYADFSLGRGVKRVWGVKVEVGSNDKITVDSNLTRSECEAVEDMGARLSRRF